MANVTGSTAGPPASGATSFTQVGPIVSITTNGNQNVLLNGTVTLGTTSSGGATALSLSACDFTAGTVLSNGITGIRVVQNEIIPMNFTLVVVIPAAGTHQYALCAATTSGNWAATNASGTMSAIAY